VVFSDVLIEAFALSGRFVTGFLGNLMEALIFRFRDYAYLLYKFREGAGVDLGRALVLQQHGRLLLAQALFR